MRNPPALVAAISTARHEVLLETYIFDFARSVLPVAQALAEGDLRVTCEVRSRDELGEVAGHLNRAVARLREDVGAIALLGERTAIGSTRLSASAAQVEAATLGISAGAESQRLQVEQATTSINAIATTLRTIGAGITADVVQIEPLRVFV